jgi:hypothetical protein
MEVSDEGEPSDEKKAHRKAVSVYAVEAMERQPQVNYEIHRNEPGEGSE